MNRPTRPASIFSKVSVKSQTVIPREVREQLGLKPGDTLRYCVTDDGVLLDKAPANEADDPFATFSEWANEAERCSDHRSSARRIAGAVCGASGKDRLHRAGPD